MTLRYIISYSGKIKEYSVIAVNLTTPVQVQWTIRGYLIAVPLLYQADMRWAHNWICDSIWRRKLICFRLTGSQTHWSARTGLKSFVRDLKSTKPFRELESNKSFRIYKDASPKKWQLSCVMRALRNGRLYHKPLIAKLKINITSTASQKFSKQKLRRRDKMSWNQSIF